ncbi:MAG: urease accessory protein UreD [Acetobacteraceae bacterium]|nr:urease accessory protein UreD [Acetobacteraceae bacterium]
MYDAASRSDFAPELQRARGELRLSFRSLEGRTTLARLRQDGALKARFPRPDAAGWANTVMLNSAGGIASGDSLSMTLAANAGARVTAATQSAERVYRALPGDNPAQVRNGIAIGGGAAVEWLPQETILFNACALDRRLEVTLETDASFLGVEALVFGRAGTGETIEHVQLRDVVRVRRDGELVLHDAIRIEGECRTLLARVATMRGARALATIVHAAPEAESRLDVLRGSLEGCDGEWGASAWNGLLLGRILTQDARALRVAVAKAVNCLRAPRPLPRVWLC